MNDPFTGFARVGGLCFSGDPKEVTDNIWGSMTLEQRVACLEKSIDRVTMVRATSGPGSLEIEFRG